MLDFVIREYLTVDGRSPFNEWLVSLREFKVRARIRARLDSVSLGNFGDQKSIGDSVFELRLFFGPGYQVYYGLETDINVVLLGGGTKSTQQRDIRTVKRYWKDYRKRNDGN